MCRMDPCATQNRSSTVYTFNPDSEFLDNRNASHAKTFI